VYKPLNTIGSIKWQLFSVYEGWLCHVTWQCYLSLWRTY